MIFKRGHLDIDNQPLVTKCYDIIKQFNIQPQFDNFGAGVITSHFEGLGFHDNSLSSNNTRQPIYWSESTALLNKIKELTDEAIKENWFNLMGLGSSVNAHVHMKAAKYVFTYYVQQNTAHSPIEFLHNDQWIKVPCEPGDWMFFDKNIPHRVMASDSDGDRISIIVNL